MDVLCTFKIKIESRNLDHGYIEDHGHIQIMVKRPNHSQKPPEYSKAQNQDLKDMHVLGNLKINLDS